MTDLEAWKEQYRSGSTRDERCRAALALAEDLWSRGLAQAAEAWLDTAQPLFDAGLDPETGPRFWALRAEAAASAADLPRAAAFLARWAQEGPGSGEVQNQALWASLRVARLSEPGRCFSAFERALRHLRRHPSPVWACRFHLEKALWLTSEAKYEEAALAWKRAASLGRAADRPREAVEALLGWSRCPSVPGARAARAAEDAWKLARDSALPALAFEARLLLASRVGGVKEAALAAELAELTAQAERDEALRAAAEAEAWAEGDRGAEGVPRGEQGQTLARVAGLVAQGDDLKGLCEELYPLWRELMPTDILGVALWVPQRRSLDYAYFVAEGRSTSLGPIPVDSPRSLGALCFREDRPLRIGHLDSEHRAYLKEFSRVADHRPQSLLFVPLRQRGRPCGILTVQSFRRQAYDRGHEAQLSVLAALLALKLQAGVRGGEAAGADSRA